MTGIEGLMSSGSVTDVTGTLYIQDEEHILLDCPHEHLVRLRTQQQLIFPHQVKEIGCRQVGDFSVFFNTATWRTPPSLNPWSSSYKN